MDIQFMQEADISIGTGSPIHLAYDAEGDILEVVFERVTPTCAVELTDNILLRFHRELGRAVGLTILDFSILASPSDLGPRSFALTGLAQLPGDLQEEVTRLLTTSPVNRFLKVSSLDSFSPHPIPLTTIERAYTMAAPV